MNKELVLEFKKLHDKLDGLRKLIVIEGVIIMADLTGLTQQVADTDAGIDSAITLIKGLAAAITAAGTDPVALQALVDSLHSKTDELAAAVVANPIP